MTFRLRAPEATDVKVSGDFVQGPQDKKGDDGVERHQAPSLRPSTAIPIASTASTCSIP